MNDSRTFLRLSKSQYTQEAFSVSRSACHISDGMRKDTLTGADRFSTGSSAPTTSEAITQLRLMSGWILASLNSVLTRYTIKYIVGVALVFPISLSVAFPCWKASRGKSIAMPDSWSEAAGEDYVRKQHCLESEENGPGVDIFIC